MISADINQSHDENSIMTMMTIDYDDYKFVFSFVVVNFDIVVVVVVDGMKIMMTRMRNSSRVRRQRDVLAYATRVASD